MRSIQNGSAEILKIARTAERVYAITVPLSNKLWNYVLNVFYFDYMCVCRLAHPHFLSSVLIVYYCVLFGSTECNNSSYNLCVHVYFMAKIDGRESNNEIYE